MTAITATQVRELRERTGAGMMECKKALEISHGDMEQAIDELRKSGRAKADKKASRVAAEGTVIILTSTDGRKAVMMEVNSETDFVARDENFLAFAKAAAQTALALQTQDVSQLLASPLQGHTQTVEEARQALITKVGENVQIRRIILTISTAPLGTYVHSGRIGVLVEMDSDQLELARDIAMHVAASKPLVVAPENVSQDLIAKEREIYSAQAASSGKPQDIIEKMVNGRLKKYLDEVSLLGQPFVKDPDITVASLLSKHKAKVLAFTRFEVGEGIEKAVQDFAAEVMSQAAR